MILKDKTSHIPWAIFKTSLDELIHAAKNLESEKIQNSPRSDYTDLQAKNY